MDAVTRILGYQTYPRSDPPVITIKAKLESDILYLLEQKQCCDLYIYFQRPESLHHLKYTELFQLYRADSSLPQYALNGNDEYFEIGADTLTRPMYLFKRPQSTTKSIVRMEMVYVNSGEIWFLRLILLKYAVFSFDNAKEDERGTQWESFQQRAISDGLIKEHEECARCYDDVSATSSPSQLRGLFVIMMSEGYPIRTIYDNEDRQSLMIEDFMR